MSETNRVANAKHIISLAKAFNQGKTRVASINGEIGERIAHAVEDGNLDPKAFKFCCALARMFSKDELKAKGFWSNIQVYYDIFEEHGLFGQKHVGDLAEMAERDEEEAEREAEERQTQDNIVKLETGIKPLPDGDGKPGTLGEAPGSYKTTH